MSLSKIKNRLKSTSKQDTSWIEKAKYRTLNEVWLEESFVFAVRLASQLKQNKLRDVFPRNKSELALAIDCKTSYVDELLKGTIQIPHNTISKIKLVLSKNKLN